MIAVIDFAALLAGLGLFGMGLAAFVAAGAYSAERKVSREALIWQLQSAQRADADYEAAKEILEGMKRKEEAISWKKEPAN